MIYLTQCDENGVPYAIDTFLTVDDAKDALWNLECRLDDATSASESYRLQGLIAELREQIAEEESDAG
jgi:hypothetical protein